MIRYHIHRHRYKIVVGVPVAILIASSLSFMRSPDDVCIVPEDTRFVEVGESVTLHVIANTSEPVNVIGADIHIPNDTLKLDEIDREGTIIDLWTQEPHTEDLGETTRISFSGGIVSDTGLLGDAIVLSFSVTPHASGTATVYYEDVEMLAHDGTGRTVSCGHHPVTLTIRDAETPSPDVNDDKVVNLFDLGIVSSRLFLAYNSIYDLNQDGRVTLSDLFVVIENMGDSDSPMGSLALSWLW